MVSAPAAERARELTTMLLDPEIRAIVPPWGRPLLVEILPHLDFDALAAADLTWVVGYPDLSTLLLALTLRPGTATLRGQNLMDTPYRLPGEVRSWHEIASTPARGCIEQRSSTRRRSVAAGVDDYAAHPEASEYTLDEPGGDGVILYLKASGDPGPVIALDQWRMRLAGWFGGVRAVLIGRTHAPAADGISARDAVRSALGDLPIPVVLDVDCGHIPPQLALVNGALARVRVAGDRGRVSQTLR